MKEILKGIGLILILITIIALIMGYMGIIDLGFYKFFGTQTANIQTQIFHENKSYIDGMTRDLANYKYQLMTEKDPIAKKAIIEMIIEKYANFDTSKILDSNLRNFLNQVKGGNYND